MKKYQKKPGEGRPNKGMRWVGPIGAEPGAETTLLYVPLDMRVIPKPSYPYLFALDSLSTLKSHFPQFKSIRA